MGGDMREKKDNGEVETKRLRGEEDNGEETVTEDEVEEFYAILRRIQAASKYLEKGEGEGRKLTTKRWKPSFIMEDFVNQDDGVKDGEGKENRVEPKRIPGLDLNTDPEVSVASDDSEGSRVEATVSISDP